MTEDTPRKRETEYRPTLGEVSHTNPYTGAVFGETQTYGRGRTVVADGGEADAVPDDGNGADHDRNGGSDHDRNGGADHDRNGGGDTLADVDHTPAGEVDGAQDSFDRGNETTSEPDDE